MNTEKTVYERMLEERFYLYRPWIPICKSIEAEVIGALELAPPVLDIGCGNGLFASFCFKEKIDCGLDYDRNAIEEAKERDVYERLEVADARSLPFKDETFQTIVSICAVEHIPQLEKVLLNIRRVLKNGGQFIFTVPSEGFGDFLFGSTLLRTFGLKRLADKYGDKKNKKSGHLHIHSPSIWRKLLKNIGFDADSIDYIFPKEAVFLWSFFHSLPFKILFLPFRPFRRLNIRPVDNILRTILKNSLSNWIEKRSRPYPSGGGYLLIKAKKD